MAEEKKPLSEHARIKLRRMVCSYAYENDPIMEFLDFENDHDLYLAAEFYMHKRQMRELAESYMNSLMEKADKVPADNRLANFIKSSKQLNGLDFWRDLIYGEPLESTDESSPKKPYSNIFYGNTERPSLEKVTRKEYIKTFFGGKNPPNDYLSNALTYLMDKTDIKEVELAEMTGLSEKTIQRMRNEIDYKPDIRTVVAVCIGLNLYPKFSNLLLQLAGIFPRNTDEDRAYMFLINHYYDATVEECNDFLRRLNIKPLTEL